MEYALENNAFILFDSAYESFVSDEGLPRSIYSVEDAKKCAIEFCSLSKTAGFTGLRCGYTIVPKTIESGGMSLNKMWLSRQTTKFNGVPYIVQRAACAVFGADGISETRRMVAHYKQNAQIIAKTMQETGTSFFGGINSPYIWLECPFGMDSWEFFDFMLEKIAVVGTPGAGFGKNGNNFFRLTAFNSKENTTEAMERFKTLC